jgi:hypothetical protein
LCEVASRLANATEDVLSCLESSADDVSDCGKEAAGSPTKAGGKSGVEARSVKTATEADGVNTRIDVGAKAAVVAAEGAGATKAKCLIFIALCEVLISFGAILTRVGEILTPFGDFPTALGLMP